ncbi:DUF4998 domain-containing protein [Parabacteroides goldsteinii]|uniref:DUF4998 domain-containing protein n=1 Tax=Parabacteroides goldsteinii TaxID=328812 RepID=UPI0032B2A0DD
MKRIYSLAILAASILSFTSCEDFMDIHEEYIEGGEIIYAPKPDSVSFIAGKGRVLFNCRTYNAPNVRSIDVYWNDGLDSLIIPVELKTGYDSISVILDNLEEKSYTFNIQTTDNFGHKSLFMTDFGTSYGDTYQATLNDRLIESLSLSDQEGTIKWYYAPQYLVRSEVRYVKKDGSQAIAKVPSTDDLVLLPDVKSGSTFEYRSLYIPEAAAIDTFATAWKEYETPFPTEYKYDRSLWKVLSVSDVSTSEGGGMDALIDDDLRTYWQSAYEGGDAPLPHWAVIDMQTPKKISKVELYRRTGNKDTKSIELYVSEHPEAETADWIKIGTAVFDEGDSSSITLPETIGAGKGRYLKLLLPDSNREPYTSVAEVYVYGK